MSRSTLALETIEIDVYSPADGVVTSIQHMDNFNANDYRFVVQHTDVVSSVYIHVDNLAEKLASFAPTDGQNVNTDISVTAGEILGSYSGSVDYNIVDSEITLTGFVRPESYTAESWKTHIPDPFEYFNDTIKETLVTKSLRTAEPAGGKIDYDIDGRLGGSWFLENTNGYAGIEASNYWLGHLAFAYDYIMPDHIIVSFGDYASDQDPHDQKQFGVVGNTPDPADVSIDTGLVKYDLVQYEYYDGAQPWDRKTLVKGLTMSNYSSIYGVALVQLVETQKLKMEIFYNQDSSQVSGFSDGAVYYVR